MSYLLFNSTTLPKPPEANFNDCDEVIDLNLIGPDRRTNRFDLGAAVGNLLALMNIWSGKRAGKPLFVCPATAGPYSSSVLWRRAKIVLDEVKIKSTREGLRCEYLLHIGAHEPQFLSLQI